MRVFEVGDHIHLTGETLVEAWIMQQRSRRTFTATIR
jgi:hypothetical protein